VCNCRNNVQYFTKLLFDFNNPEVFSSTEDWNFTRDRKLPKRTEHVRLYVPLVNVVHAAPVTILDSHWHCSLLDAYRLRRTQQIPVLCVI